MGDGSARGASWGRSGCAIHAQPGPRRTAGSFDPAGEFLVVAGDRRRRDGSALAVALEGQPRQLGPKPPWSSSPAMGPGPRERQRFSTIKAIKAS